MIFWPLVSHLDLVLRPSQRKHLKSLWTFSAFAFLSEHRRCVADVSELTRLNVSWCLAHKGRGLVGKCLLKAAKELFFFFILNRYITSQKLPSLWKHMKQANNVCLPIYFCASLDLKSKTPLIFDQRKSSLFRFYSNDDIFFWHWRRFHTCQLPGNFKWTTILFFFLIFFVLCKRTQYSVKIM